MSAKFLLCELARPFILALPFGRVRVLALLGGRDQQDPSWLSHPNPIRVFYDRNIHAYIAADLREWGGRWHYFTGRYYDQANRLLIEKFLGPGDTYIDIGANVGLQSLAAARLVGPQGLVIAIEPNPATFAMLEAHVRINRGGHRANIRLCNVGLSHQPDTLRLVNDSQHSGTCTFRNISKIVESVEVPVVVGDDLLATIPRPTSRRTLVKIDTEGFEHLVLRGLSKLLAAANIAFVVEVTDEWLRQTGSSAQQLYADMHALGFTSYGMQTHYPIFRPALRLFEQQVPVGGQHDVLFARQDFLSSALAAPIIAGNP